MAGEEHELEDKYPIGFRFKPNDEELVEYYLVPSLRRQPIVPNDFITSCDVYKWHPDTLTKMHKGVDEEEWYFLSPRYRMYGNGVRPRRKTRDGRGRWKASTASKEVDQTVVCNGITFCRSVLNYFEGVPKKEVRTKWIMLELKVPCFEIKLDRPGPKTKLDEFVVCKIYVSPQHKKRGDADEEGTSSAWEVDDGDEEQACSALQDGEGTSGSMFSESQAAKRPMLEKGRPGSQDIASTQQASCFTSNAPWTQVHSGAPGGQPTLGAHSSSQAPQMPQRPQVGAQRLVQLPPQQAPAPYQSFSDARDQRPFGQTTTTTTTRPPASVNLGYPGNPPRKQLGWAYCPPQRDPGTTAFRPQVSLQCHYDQNYRGVKPPAVHNVSSSQPQMLASSSSSFLQPQQTFVNGDANRSQAAAATGGTPYGSYEPYQSSSLTLEAAGHDGAANGRNGAPQVNANNINDEQFFVDLAMTTSNPSLAGAPTQMATAPAPARLVESQAPVAAGVVKVETET